VASGEFFVKIRGLKVNWHRREFMAVTAIQQHSAFIASVVLLADATRIYKGK
jgi:hypothetical protein